MILLTQQSVPLPTSVFKNEWLQVVVIILYLFVNASVLIAPHILKRRRANIKRLERRIEEFDMLEDKLEKCLQAIREAIIMCKHLVGATHAFSEEATKATVVTYFQNYFLEIWKLLFKTLQKMGVNASELEVEED